jgi:hypothetical protein
LSVEIDEILNLIQQLDSFHSSIAIQFLKSLATRVALVQEDEMLQAKNSSSNSNSISNGITNDLGNLRQSIEIESIESTDPVLSFVDSKLTELEADYEAAKLELAKSIADKHRTMAQRQRRPKKLSGKHPKQASQRELRALQTPFVEPDQVARDDFDRSVVDVDKLRKRLLKIEEEVHRLHVRRQSLTFRTTLNKATLAVRKAYASAYACQVLLEIAESIVESAGEESNHLRGQE